MGGLNAISNSKACSKCKIEKPLNDFYNFKKGKHGKGCYCKDCSRLHTNEYRANNREQVNRWQRDYVNYNKEVVQQRKKIYYSNNKEKEHLRHKEWVINNREHLKQYQKEYYNTEEWKQYNNNFRNEQYKSNINFRLASNIRSRMNLALKRYTKTGSTIELLGCNIETFKRYIEGQFKDGMSWDNHGYRGWHIDHVKPVTLFDLTDPEQQRECFNYKNLQPLWAEDNLSKSAKYGEG